MSAKALAQRRAAAKKSRPRPAPTDQEVLDRLAASRLLKSLDLPCVQNAARRLKLESRLMGVIEAELDRDEPDGDYLSRIAQTMRALDGAQVAAGVWDRTGRPRVQKLEADLRSAPRLFLNSPETDAEWTKAEEAHAGGSPAPNGHADGAARS